MSKTEAISEPSKLQSAELGTPEGEGAEPRGGSVDLKHVLKGAPPELLQSKGAKPARRCEESCFAGSRIWSEGPPRRRARGR